MKNFSIKTNNNEKSRKIIRAYAVYSRTSAHLTKKPSSRALEEGVAIHKKSRKRMDCDVAALLAMTTMLLSRKIIRAYAVYSRTSAHLTKKPSSRALEEGVAIHKKSRKRMDCDVAALLAMTTMLLSRKIIFTPHPPSPAPSGRPLQQGERF